MKIVIVNGNLKLAGNIRMELVASGVGSNNILCLFYNNRFSKDSYVPESMKELRQEYPRETFRLLFDWNFFDPSGEQKEINDVAILSNMKKGLQEGDSVILTSKDRKRSEEALRELEESNAEGVEISLYEGGKYVELEIFHEEKTSHVEMMK
jgi:hypothetical protein